MTEQLFRATKEDGSTRLLRLIGTIGYKGERIFANISNQYPSIDFQYRECDLTDLRPVRVVDVDAVVIDVALCSGIENLNRALESAYKVVPRADRHAISSLIHQLTQLLTPAEPAAGGEKKCSCLRMEFERHKAGCALHECFVKPPQSPKGVTIEGVTAEEIKKIIDFANSRMVREYFPGATLEMFGIGKAILDQLINPTKEG